MTSTRKNALEAFKNRHTGYKTAGWGMFLIPQDEIDLITTALTPIAGDVAEAVEAAEHILPALFIHRERFRNSLVEIESGSYLTYGHLETLISAATQAEQLRARVAELEKAQEWRDIGSAPKGTIILVTNGNGTWPSTWRDGYGGEGFYELGDDCVKINNATHYMHLPSSAKGE